MLLNIRFATHNLLERDAIFAIAEKLSWSNLSIAYIAAATINEKIPIPIAEYLKVLLIFQLENFK